MCRFRCPQCLLSIRRSLQQTYALLNNLLSLLRATSSSMWRADTEGRSRESLNRSNQSLQCEQCCHEAHVSAVGMGQRLTSRAAELHINVLPARGATVAIAVLRVQ